MREKFFIPEDDEPLTEEELKRIEKARDEIKRGEYVTLDQLLKRLEDKSEDD